MAKEGRAVSFQRAWDMVTLSKQMMTHAPVREVVEQALGWTPSDPDPFEFDQLTLMAAVRAFPLDSPMPTVAKRLKWSRLDTSRYTAQCTLEPIFVLQLRHTDFGVAAVAPLLAPLPPSGVASTVDDVHAMADELDWDHRSLSDEDLYDDMDG